MTGKSGTKEESGFNDEPVGKRTECCQVDALISIDGRGQLVLPKEVREKTKIKAGDKFVVIRYRSGSEVCCLFLVKAEQFSETVKGMLGPMMKEILR